MQEKIKLYNLRKRVRTLGYSISQIKLGRDILGRFARVITITIN